MKLRSGTPEQEMAWDARRSDACKILIARIYRHLSGWKVIFRPLALRAIARLNREMQNCDDSWFSTFMYQQSEDRTRRETLEVLEGYIARRLVEIRKSKFSFRI